MKLTDQETSTELPVISMMIVGAPKAGTTSLKSYLGQHPGIVTHSQREFIYFASDAAYRRGAERAWKLHFGERIAPGSSIIAKSVSMMYSQDALERLRAHSPFVQLVLVLREPVARAYSEYWYARRRGQEAASSFREALERIARTEQEDPRSPDAYLARSRYVEHVRAIQRMFPPDRISVLLLEEMERDPATSCQSLFGKLAGIDPHFIPSTLHRENEAAAPRSKLLLDLTSRARELPLLRAGLRAVLGERTRQRLKSALENLNDAPLAPPPLDPSTSRRLADYFEPWNRELEQTLGRSLDAWRATPDAPNR
jgi:hypothetical protein